jgi:hypothetical protein
MSPQVYVRPVVRRSLLLTSHLRPDPLNLCAAKIKKLSWR